MVRVAVIDGDGIGPEVVGAGVRVLEAAAEALRKGSHVPLEAVSPDGGRALEPAMTRSEV